MKKNQNLKTIYAGAILIAATFMAGCENNDEGDFVPMGSVSIAVTDSPIDDVSAVFVQFSGMELYNTDGSEKEITFDPPKLVNLLSLQGSLSEEVLTEYAIPAGDYSYATFNIDINESYLVMKGEPSINLPMVLSPLLNVGAFIKDILLNGSDEAYPIVPFSIQEGETTHLTFDFDLRKSIFSEGVSNTYSFSPAIRSVLTNEAGSIAGSITSNLPGCVDENSAIYIYSGRSQALMDIRGLSSDPISTSNINTDNGNSYELGFLPHGDYTIAIACDAADDAVNEDDILSFEGKQNITVVAGQTTNHDF